jgi:uncharacterized protein (TIGR03066 family)
MEVRMSAIHVVLGWAVCCVVLFCGRLRADDKPETTNKDKIVGKWEASRGPSADLEAVMEFTKNGKIKASYKKGGETIMFDGRYEIDGDKVKLTIRQGKEERTDTMTIKTISDKALILTDSKGQTDEFMRN